LVHGERISGWHSIHLGSWLVNTARGAIIVKEDVAEAIKSGHLRGYGGDVWFPQPAPQDHPLRYVQGPWGGGNAMVPHMSGTSIDAQIRYAQGVKNILESYFSGRDDYRPADLIVHKGDYVTRAYGQRSKAWIRLRWRYRGLLTMVLLYWQMMRSYFEIWIH
jgi:formate dehydrogenase